MMGGSTGQEIEVVQKSVLHDVSMSELAKFVCKNAESPCRDLKAKDEMSSFT